MQRLLNWAISSKINSSNLKSSSNSNNNRKGKRASNISIDSTNKRKLRQHKCKALSNHQRCSKASFIRWKLKLIIITMKTILKHRTYMQTFPQGRRNQLRTSSVKQWPSKVHLQPFNKHLLLSHQYILLTNRLFQVENLRPLLYLQLSSIMVAMVIRTTNSMSIQWLKIKLM